MFVFTYLTLFCAAASLASAWTGKNLADPLAPHSRNGRGSFSNLQPAVLWQGLHFSWLRKDLDFETPHRLGSVGSYIYNVSSACSSSNCSVDATYSLQLTPGVSGDYAHPNVFYTSFAFTDPSFVKIQTGNFSFSFQDNSSSDPVPHAETSINTHITIPLAHAQSLISSQQTQLLLQGFQIEMKCVPSAEHDCNSNATWPYYFNLSLAEPCSVAVKVISCPLSFGLGRGWTPSHGGGKPYNYQMAYNVTVFFTALTHSTTEVTSYVHRILQKGDIFQEPLSGQQTLPNTSSSKQDIILGITELSWNLLETKGHQNRGRYLEELAFSLQPDTQKQTRKKRGEREDEDGEITYSWRMGYRAPHLTTYASNVEYSMVAAALVVPRGTILMSDALTANGTVCMDNKDFFPFHCSRLGLKSQTIDSVFIHSQLPFQF